MENDCLFCKIIAGKIPSTFVYKEKDNEVVAFKDINPQAPHHILIVPGRHIASMDQLTLEDGDLLARIFTVAQKVAHELGMEQGYRFITNVGPHAGQSVAHLHFHLLGGKALGWTPG